jgi:hypothetical protein
MTRGYLTLSVILLFLSCAKFGYNDRAYGDKENFGLDLAMLIRNYSDTYNKSPQSAKDLMIFIDRMDENSRLICEGCYRYDYQYLYLKNNKDKLIFVTDSLISVYYKNIENNNLLIQISTSNPCSSVDVPSAVFFDKDDLYVWSDTLSMITVSRIFREYWGYYFKTKDNTNREIIFEKTKFEYTPNQLKDLCKGEVLDINRSPFIKNTFDYLDSLAYANDFSRIIASGFIDRP